MDLCQTAQVCKEFKVLSTDDGLWRRFFVKLQTKEAPSARVCHSALVFVDFLWVNEFLNIQSGL